MLVRFQTNSGLTWLNSAMVTDIETGKPGEVRIYLLGGVGEDPNCRVVLGTLDDVAARLNGEAR